MSLSRTLLLLLESAVIDEEISEVTERIEQDQKAIVRDRVRLARLTRSDTIT